MHEADKKIPDWSDDDLQTHFPDLYTSHDQSRPWRALLAGAIVGLIGVLLFVVMSACTPAYDPTYIGVRKVYERQ